MQESVYVWFDGFKTFLKAKNIESADQIYNCDESGFPLQTSTSMKVCVDKRVRRNFQIASNSKTSLQCICANGSVVPPCVLFPGKKFNPEYGISFPTNFILDLQRIVGRKHQNFTVGSLTSLLTAFHLRHVVLLIDGHIKYHVSQFCAENEILLLQLPPHTTSHAIQPTDRSYFATFKANFSKEVSKFTLEQVN